MTFFPLRAASVALVAVALAGSARADELKLSTAPAYTNRLIHSADPYLLLHAHNPVDWYPWGPEAFAKAKADGKPIFLSVGYSTCYWCHVAEKTIYSDPRHREADERLVRQREGRPRGASPGGSPLHGRDVHAGMVMPPGPTTCS